jgi:hypothetical protein
MFDFDRLWWNEPTRVFCARRGRSEFTTVVLTESGVRDTSSACCARAVIAST